MDALVLHVRPRPTLRVYLNEANRFSILASPDQSRHESSEPAQTPSTGSPARESVERLVARRRRVPMVGEGKEKPTTQGKRLALSDVSANVARPAVSAVSAKQAKPRRALDTRARGTSTTVRKAREAARAAKEAASVAEAAARERSEGAVRAYSSPSPFEAQRAFITAAEATALEADAEETTPPRGPGHTTAAPDPSELPPATHPVPHVPLPSPARPPPPASDKPLVSSSAAASTPVTPPLMEEGVTTAAALPPTPAQRLREQAQARLGAAQTALQAVRGSLSPPPVGAAKSAACEGACDAPSAPGQRAVSSAADAMEHGVEAAAASEPVAVPVAERAAAPAEESTSTAPEAIEHGAQAGPGFHPVTEVPHAARPEAGEADGLPPRIPASVFLPGDPAQPESSRQTATTDVVIAVMPRAAPMPIPAPVWTAPEACRVGWLNRSLQACLAPVRALVRAVEEAAAEEASARREAAGAALPSLRRGKLGVVRRYGRRRTPRFVMPTISEAVEVTVHGGMISATAIAASKLDAVTARIRRS